MSFTVSELIRKQIYRGLGERLQNLRLNGFFGVVLDSNTDLLDFEGGQSLTHNYSYLSF